MSKLLIVRMASECPPPVKKAFENIAPGSVVVAKENNGFVWLHFEGGIYTRAKDREPTPEERIDYAKRAAGRADQNYPTMARIQIASWEGLEVCGYVDTRNYEVVFGVPYLTFRHPSREKPLSKISAQGTFEGEIDSTKGLLAYEHGLPEDEITCTVEYDDSSLTVIGVGAGDD